MAGRTVPVSVTLLGNSADLEAALVRSGLVAQDASKQIQGSAAAAGRAAAEQARTTGAAADEQAAAAAKAASAWVEASEGITAAQRAAGNAAVSASRMVSASVDEQRAAYVKAVASTAEYEAAQERVAGSAKLAGAEAAAAARLIGASADEQAAAAGKAAAAWTESASRMSAAQKIAGQSAAEAAAAVGAGVDEQAAAFQRAVSSQAEYEAATKAASLAAKDQASAADAAAAAQARYADSLERVTGSAKANGDAAAAAAKEVGASADEQAAAAGRAAAAWTDASAKMSAAQKAAGAAAVEAARETGASVDEQTAAYTKAVVAQRDYEASATKAAAATDAVAASASKGSKAVSTFGGVALAGMAAGTYEAVKGAVSLQKQMEMLHTQAGASQQQVQQLTSAVLKLGPQVATGPNELAQAMYHVTSSFNATIPAAQRVSQETDILRVASEGAKVGNADLVDVTNALDAAIRSGIPGVQNYKAAMGALNTTVGAGDMTMQDLANALGTGLLGPMKTYGVNLQSISAALATFGDNNIRGQRAATMLSSAIRIMAAPSAAAAGALKTVGLGANQLGEAIRSGGLPAALTLLKQKLVDSGDTATQQAHVITAAFGGRQSTGVQVLLNQLDTLKAKYQQVGQGANEFGQDWAGTQKTVAFQADQLKAKVESLGDSFGTMLIPKLEAAAGALDTVVSWLDKHKAAASALAEVIVGVLGLAISTFAYKTAVSFVSATKDMLAGVGKLAQGVASGASGMVTSFTNIGGASEAAEGEVATAGAGMVEAADATAEGVDDALGASGLGLVIVALGLGATELGTHWSAVMHDMALAANAMVESAEKGLDGLIKLVNGASGGLNKALGVVGIHIPTIPDVGVGGVLPTGSGYNPSTYGAVGLPSPKQLAAVPPANSPLWEGGKVIDGVTMGPNGLVLASSGTGNVTVPTGSGGKVNIPKVSIPTGGGGGGGSTGTGTGTTSASGTPASYNQQTFALAVLQQLGIQPTTQNVQDLTAWESAEGGNWNNTAKYNPLNTTLSEPGAAIMPGGSSAGVKAYTSWQQGLSATVSTLKNGDYGSILTALGSNAPLSQFRSNPGLGTWGTGSIGSSISGSVLSAQQIKALENGTSGLSGSQSTTTTAAATATIPAAVATMLSTAQSLEGTKYTWGGGHGSTFDPVDTLKQIGIDCSGFVSAVLHSGGFLSAPQDTEGLASSLLPGKGSATGVTVYDRSTGPQNNQHAFMEIDGKYFMAGGGANSAGGAVQQISQSQVNQELAGGGFKAYHPALNPNGQMVTPGNVAASGAATEAAYEKALETAITNALKALQTSGNSELQKLDSDTQNGSVRALEKVLGVSTSNGVAGQLRGVIEQLGPNATMGQITSAQGPANTKGFAQTLTSELVNVHGKALQALDGALGVKWGTATDTLVTKLVGLHGAALEKIVNLLGGSQTLVGGPASSGLRKIAGTLKSGPSHSGSSIESILNASIGGKPEETASLAVLLQGMTGTDSGIMDKVAGVKKGSSAATAAQHLSGLSGGALKKVIAELGNSDTAVGGKNSAALRGVAGVLKAGPTGEPNEQSFDKLIASLRAAHTAALTKLANQLVAAHKAALDALAEELYAAQLQKDTESLTLEATQLKDQTQLLSDNLADQLTVQKDIWTAQSDAAQAEIQASKDQEQSASDAAQAATQASKDAEQAVSDAAQAMSQAMKDQEQLVSDASAAQTQYVKDMTQTAQDEFAQMTQYVKDQTQLMADESAGNVTGIQDQSQTEVDTLAERGLFGLNLIAQQMTVQLDVLKAGFDAQIAAAQDQLDLLQQQADQQEAAAQVQLDQATTAEDQLVAAAQLNLDTVTLQQDAAVAAAQAHVDAVTSAEDAAVAASQQNLDAVTAYEDAAEAGAQAHADSVQVAQDSAVSRAQAHSDAVTLQQDLIVQGAQTAVDLDGNDSKSKQDVLAQQLANAQAQASVSEAQAAANLGNVQSYANAAIGQANAVSQYVQNNAAAALQAATNQYTDAQNAAAQAVQSASAAYTNAQNAAAIAVQQASNAYTDAQDTANATIQASQTNLANITNSYNLLLAQASQNLQGVQDTAAEQEALLQGQINVEQEAATTEFAGSGLVVNIEGINSTDAAGIADAVGWTLRSVLAG